MINSTSNLESANTRRISKKLCHIKPLSEQQGAMLITALIFLIIMTMLALASMGTNTLEERMASNYQEVNRLFQAAEAALKQVEAQGNDAMDDQSGLKNSDVDSLFGLGNDIEIEYWSIYQQQGIVERGTTASSADEQALQHYDFIGQSTAGGVTTILHTGAYRLAGKTDNY